MPADLALVPDMPPPMVAAVNDDEPPLVKLRQQYKDWAKAKQAEREEALLARHYYHADQYTEEVLKEFRKRKQPPVVYNRVSRKIDGIAGTIERLRQDPKAFARTPQHEQGAELATAALRYALDQARWEDKESTIVRDVGIEGIGYVELMIEQGDRGDVEIGIEEGEPETFFYDPRSFRRDFSDARYMGTAKWMHIDDVKDLEGVDPEIADSLDGLMTQGADFASTEARDKDMVWLNVEKKHVRVAMHWYRERGEWLWCLYTADLILASGTSPFVDEKGKTICGLIPWSSYVDHDGDRYGFFRNLKGPQDEVNSRRSKALHQLNTRRIITERGAVDDVEKARTEAARPDGFIEVQRGFRFDFDDNAKQAELAGQINMLAEAKAEIENFGPTLVEKGMEKSGRAIQLLQQAGLAELGPFLSAYRGWKLRIYRAVWTNIRRHWTAERWIRVTDDQNAEHFVQVNGMQPDEYGQPQMINALGDLDVDIILDEAPDSITTMADVFELLQSLVSAGHMIPPAAIVKMAGLPLSVQKEILPMLTPPPPPPPDPMLEMAKQTALEQEQSKTALNKASALDKFASASQKMGQVLSPPDSEPQQPVY